MSADNGIYIGKFKDGFKVIHASAIDNLNYHHNKTQNEISDEWNWAAVYDYYKGQELLTEKQIKNKAFSLEKSIDYTEYGINTLDFSQFTWNEVFFKAKEKAREELPYLKSKGWNSLVEAYQSIIAL